MPNSTDPVISRVLMEKRQAHQTRKRLFVQLEHELGRPVVSYFTSFTAGASIDDSDADIMQGILQKLDLSRGLALLISSPGGSGLAAERMINVCRTYSGTGEYWAIVPGKAKSAATMICFGAAKILMGATSELGPIDPQVPVEEDGKFRWYSAHNIVQSYRELFDRAVAAKGNLEPFLQQLAHYDEREIAEYASQIELAKDIAVRTLRQGMMQGCSEEDIEAKIGMFLTPSTTKTHGRPIFPAEARNCGLKVDEISGESRTWELIYELYIRTNEFLWQNAAKAIESSKHAFSQSARGGS
ncbi:MAG: hypothetical protein V1772_09210 [Chloroflexota bacterium]